MFYELSSVVRFGLLRYNPLKENSVTSACIERALVLRKRNSWMQ